MIGKLLRNVRAGEHRSPFAGPDFIASYDITVTSAEFDDGGPMPTTSAGKGVGEDRSPQLSWSGIPPQTRQLVLIIDDVDVVNVVDAHLAYFEAIGAVGPKALDDI